MSENTITLSVDDAVAMALVSHIRSEVNGLPKWAMYVDTHGVTSETVKDHAVALAVLAYPNIPQVQKKDGKRTKFGNAVQAAGNGLRRAISKDSDNDGEPAVQALLTKAGFAATLEEVTAAWKSAQV